MKLAQMQNRAMNKKGNMSALDVLGTITAIALGTLIVAIVLILLAQFQSDSSVTVNSTAYNSTGNALKFAENATSKFPLAGTIAGFMFILGIVGGLGYYGYRKVKGQ